MPQGTASAASASTCFVVVSIKDSLQVTVMSCSHAFLLLTVRLPYTPGLTRSVCAAEQCSNKALNASKMSETIETINSYFLVQISTLCLR
jgi:hypothetical protein